MHVGCGSELLPERRDRSCELRTNPCCRRRARTTHATRRPFFSTRG